MYEQYIRLIDGKLAWDMQATHGVPLEIALEVLWSNQFIPTWDRLLEFARKDGSNMDRLTQKLIDFSFNIYPRHIALYIEAHLAQLVEAADLKSAK